MLQSDTAVDIAQVLVVALYAAQRVFRLDARDNQLRARGVGEGLPCR